MIQTNEVPAVDIPAAPRTGEEAFNMLKGLSIDDALSNIANSMVDFSFKLLIAVVVFYVGRFIIRKLYDFVHKLMVNRKVDRSLTTFLLSMVRIVLYFILIITIIGILGIETSSFLALFASAGVAIGMALSGTLQNFAGGVLILLLKPYKVGDYIEAQGYAGTVGEIQIFHTVINTPDNKRIIIPNGGLSTGSINNYSTENYRRVDWTISLSYDTDYDAAEAEIRRILLSDDRVVVKYIEDDMEKRGHAAEEAREKARREAIAHGETPDEEEELKEPSSWWGRVTESRRHKRMRLARSLKQHVGLGPVATQPVDRAPFVGLGALADSSIDITVRAWTHSSNYWNLFFDMNARFYKELPKAGFSFPFPQMDVHVDGKL